MRDGVKLATDVYLPREGEGKFPVILIRTPYNKAGNAGTAANVAKLGYALVVQDIRGRFASEGDDAIIFGNDGIGGGPADGHTTIDWVAKQAWCDGNIVTYGGSALGITQNMAAPARPRRSRAKMLAWPSPTITTRRLIRAACGGPSCSKVGSRRRRWKK